MYPVGVYFYYAQGMTIGQRISALRKDANMTLEELSARIVTDKKPDGLTKQAISAWEKDRNEPTASQILMLCEIFSTTPDYLLLGNENNLSAAALSYAAKYDKLDEIGRFRMDRIYMAAREPVSDDRIEKAYNAGAKDAKTSLEEPAHNRRSTDK